MKSLRHVFRIIGLPLLLGAPLMEVGLFVLVVITFPAYFYCMVVVSMFITYFLASLLVISGIRGARGYSNKSLVTLLPKTLFLGIVWLLIAIGAYGIAMVLSVRMITLLVDMVLFPILLSLLSLCSKASLISLFNEKVPFIRKLSWSVLQLWNMDKIVFLFEFAKIMLFIGGGYVVVTLALTRYEWSMLNYINVMMVILGIVLFLDVLELGYVTYILHPITISLKRAKKVPYPAD